MQDQQEEIIKLKEEQHQYQIPQIEQIITPINKRLSKRADSIASLNNSLLTYTKFLY